MDIQFCHSRRYLGLNRRLLTAGAELSSKGGETIAVELIQPWLAEALLPGEHIEKKVGKARCSDEDNYNKAVGRELATKRMKATRLTVVSNTDFDGVRILVLKDPTGNMLVFEKKPQYKRVHFVGYNE